MSEIHHPNEINRDYIRLLQGMSRFIREEFSVSIRMTQEDAVEQLLHYARQSENLVLKEMSKELLEFTITTEDTPERPLSPQAGGESGVRYYRGAPVAGSGKETDKRASASSSAAPATEANAKPVRVYRGQVISG